MTTCVVAAGVGKEGSRKPSLLGRNRRIELATKQQNVRNSANKKFEERVFFNLDTIPQIYFYDHIDYSEYHR